MLPLITFKKANNSILKRGHPLLKMAIFLCGLIYLFAVPINFRLWFLLPPLLFILLLFVLASAWQNRKIYGLMLFPFLSFFLVLAVLLGIIYSLKSGGNYPSGFYLKGTKHLGLMFIKGALIVSLSYVFIITTNRTELLYALKKMKIPVFIISQLFFVLRSLELLTNEFRLLPLALRSRGLVKTKARGKIRNLLYSIFYRTIKRGEIFESALHSRGFKGEFFTLYSPRKN